MMLQVPFEVSMGQVCPHTNRLLLAHGNHIDCYSMKSPPTQKFTVDHGSPVLSVAVGYVWRGEEAVVFVVCSGGLGVVSLVDGACLQMVRCDRLTRVCMHDTRVYVVREGRVWVCEDVDGLIEGEVEDDLNHYFSVISVKQRLVNDIAIVNTRLWPHDTTSHEYVVSVGAEPSLLMTKAKDVHGSGGLVSRMASLVLRTGGNTGDGVYNEPARRFDRVAVFDDTAMVTDNTSGRVVVFDVRTLLVKHIFKGVRGALPMDATRIFHPRTRRLLHVDGTDRLLDGYLIVGELLLAGKTSQSQQSLETDNHTTITLLSPELHTAADE